MSIMVIEGWTRGGLFGTAAEPATGISLESSLYTIRDVLTGMPAMPMPKPAPRSPVTSETSLEDLRRLLAG